MKRKKPIKKHRYEVVLAMPYAEVFVIEASSAKEALEIAESGLVCADYTLPETKTRVRRMANPEGRAE